MTTEDEHQEQFTNIMYFLSLNFPERKLTADLVQAYYIVLKDFPIDDIDAMARAYVLKGRVFPHIADLVPS